MWTRSEETIGDGFIMFTATGHDKTGRVDVAVGAADTKGRSGKYLADSIMTAQTRATRRLTLQFVGGGLLDESEVQSTTTDISRSTQPLAEIAAPAKLSPNAAPGRDITQDAVKATAPAIAAQVDITLPVITGQETPIDPAVVAIIQEGIAALAPKKRRRRKGEVVLESPGQEAPPTPTNGPTAAQEAAALALAGVSATKLAVAAEVVPEPPNRLYCLTCDVPLFNGAVPDQPGKVWNVNADGTPHICAPKVEAPAPIVRKDQPNDEQKKAFRDRLFTYTNTVLREGKMVPCEGIGGVERKVALYVQTMFADAKETRFLTVNQWETFLGFLDEKLKELGAEGLVKLINQKIGAKE